MFTRGQLMEIDEKLRKGVLPEVIAGDFGLSYTGFRNALYRSGQQWEVTRKLVPTGPADDIQATNAIQEGALCAHT